MQLPLKTPSITKISDLHLHSHLRAAGRAHAAVGLRRVSIDEIARVGYQAYARRAAEHARGHWQDYLRTRERGL